MASLTVGQACPRHRKTSATCKVLQHLRSVSMESADTFTSEDSCGLAKKKPAPVVSMNVTPRTDAQSQVAGNPRIVIHGSGHNAKTASPSTSTEDGYYGFGISQTQRHDLMDHLKGFRDLTEQQKWESPEGSRRGPSPSPSSADELCLTEASSCYLSQYSDPFDEHSPLSPASLFAQKTFFQENDLEAFKASTTKDSLDPQDGTVSETSSRGRERLGSGSSYGREMTLSPLQARIAHACLNDVHMGDRRDGEEESEKHDGRCVAFGAGLSFGQVGVQNNFQVWTDRPGNSCVTVAVFGPRSHCVTETSVTYIGDNLYDVSYSVTSPGYYVIVVKWGDQSLPDSPYICKVTY